MRKALAAVAFFVCSAPVQAQVMLDDETEAPAWLAQRSIVGNDDLEPIEAVKGTTAYDAAKIVARVETRSGSGFCTGSRIAPDLFLTNHHCFEVTPCNNMQFHMGYERDLPASQQVTFRCVEVLSRNLTLDYALFRVETGKSAALESTFPTARLFTGTLRVGQPLIVASHPSARMKEIDRSSHCTLRTTNAEYASERKTLTHNCDTEGGSSGSPVLDKATGQVVALHWGGANAFNFAIPMSLIVQDLRTALPPSDFSKLAVRR